MRSREHLTTTCAASVFGAAVILLSSLVSSQSVYAKAEGIPNSAISVETASAAQTAVATTGSDTDQLQAFLNAIASAESTEGVYGARLAEKLLDLGLALQRDGRHADALDVFKRGSHLARINNGLNTAAQIPYLEREISSHRALGEFTRVDEAQTRLYRAQIRSLDDSEALVTALIQQSQWQLEAYYLGVGGTDMSYSRLLNMWDLNRKAVTSVIDREGEMSPQLLPPLYAMLQTQYMISGHKNRNKKNASDFRTETATRRDHHRFKRYMENGYDKGRSILRAIYGIQAAQNGEDSPAAIGTRVMLADWMLWYGMRVPAMRLYTQAAGELAQLDDAQVQTEGLLGAPVALPDIDGVRPLLPEVGASEGNILLKFAVNPNGRVIDLVRIRDNGADKLLPGEASQSQAHRFMLALYKTKFRPRFVQGEATLTENVVKAYVIN